jgi:predicted Zn-dependent peptidase
VFQKTVLPNGLRIMTSRMPHARSAAVSLYVGAGNRYEDETTSGLSHYLEHVLFKGTVRYPTPKLVSETIESVGGVLNAATDREATVFYAKIPKAHTASAIDLLVDMLRAPLMEPAEFEKERGVILEELAATQDSPPDQASQLLDSILFPDQPLGWDIGGTPESVAALTRQQALDYMAQQYVPNNVVMSVAGDVDHERVVEQVSELAADWTRAAPSKWHPHSNGHRGPVVRVKSKKTEQAHLSMAVPGYHLLHPDRQALDILSTILGEGMSSRLFMEIREVRGLAYDVHSYIEHYHDTGVFGVGAGTDPNNAAETVSAILEELARIRDHPVDDDELAKAKRLAAGRLELRMEDTRAVSGWVGSQEILINRVLTPDEVLARIQRLTPGDLSRVAADLLRRDALHLAVVGPYRGAAKFAPLLNL